MKWKHWFNEKKQTVTIIKSYSLFILVISNNPPGTMTEQPRYCERNTQECLEKGRKSYDDNSAWQQKLAHDQIMIKTEHHIKKKNIGKGNT